MDPHATTETPEQTSSLFDHFGGHYAALIDGVEVARFAPSDYWSDYAAQMRQVPGFSIRWVPEPEVEREYRVSRSPSGLTTDRPAADRGPMTLDQARGWLRTDQAAGHAPHAYIEYRERAVVDWSPWTDLDAGR